MMLQMNSTYKMNKPSAIITRPIEDDDKDSHTLSDVSRENSEDENWLNELDSIVNPVAIGNVVEDKDSEMYFLQWKCSLNQKKNVLIRSKIAWQNSKRKYAHWCRRNKKERLDGYTPETTKL